MVFKESYKKLNLAKRLHLDGCLNFVSAQANKVTGFMNRQVAKVGNYFNDMLNKSPKIKNGAETVANKLKGWTTRDYLATGLAAFLATKHAVKVVKSPEKAVNPTEVTEILEDEIVIDETIKLKDDYIKTITTKKRPQRGRTKK